MPVRNQIGVRELGQKFNLDQDFFQPAMVISYRHTLACEVAQLTSIDLVAHKQDDAFAAFSKDSFFNEEGFKIIWAECFFAYSATGLLRCAAGCFISVKGFVLDLDGRGSGRVRRRSG